MWKSSEDVKSGVGQDNRPIQRRRWDAISHPNILTSHLEYSPPQSSRWDASTQVPSERRLLLQRVAASVENNNSSSSRPTCWSVSTQVSSNPKLCSSHMMEYLPSRPSRIAGGNGCNCCPYLPCPERPVESCLPGLHQKYVDVYDSKKCIEGHLPTGYRSFVEHDDLYLPPSRPLSPASIDHDDLYLPIKTCKEYSPRCPCPYDLRICDSDPTYGDIYLPPSRPCTPAFPKDPCGYPPPSYPCPPPPCPPPCCPPPCNPCPPPPCPPRPSSCGPKIQCSCPPYIKKLAPCPTPPSNDCSCPPYIKKLPGCSSSLSSSPPPSPPRSPSCSRSRPVQQCSSIYIDEVPSPPIGTRYVACQECLCHKDISTRSLCPSPKKVSPCRDCVCHLGGRSPSQGGSGCPPKGTHTRCQAGFQTPGKPRLKLHLNQSQCLECKSPYKCKGPSNCNPQYIVETPLSPNSARSRSPSPSLRSRSPMRGGNCSAMSSRCQSCDCHKSPNHNCSGPPKVSPKLFEDPCCSPCRPITQCRPLLAAEMLSGMEACASQAKAFGKNPSSCTDPRCATCECHKPKYPPSSPPPYQPTPPSPPCSPCSNQLPPNSSCRSPPPSCSPCRPIGPSCSSFDNDVHNPTFKSFQSTSPRCKDCDCHKPKNCKLSTQICKFCRGAGWCYCEYHTTQQLLTDCSEQSTSQRDDYVEVDETVVSQVSSVSPELSTRSAKVDFDSLCDEEIESTPRVLGKDMPLQSDVTQLCCCGKCEYTKPRFPIKTECPFCKHIHSCCCGMCSCPIPSCSSKTPLALDNATPRMSLNYSGASIGQSNLLLPYSNHRPKAVTQVPKKKLGFTSPNKSSPKPFSTSNSQLSSARVCYSSQKTRMKLSVQQSPTRRS